MYRTRSVLAVSTARRRPGQVAFASPLRNVGMRILAFDGRMGASGDMILATLLDAGADPDVLEPVTDAPRGGVSDRRDDEARHRRNDGRRVADGRGGERRRRTRPRSPPRHRSPPRPGRFGSRARPRRHSSRGSRPPPQLSRGPRDCRRDGPRAAGRTRRARDLRTARRGGGERPRRGTRGDSLPRGGSRRRDRGRGRCHGLASRP